MKEKPPPSAACLSCLRAAKTTCPAPESARPAARTSWHVARARACPRCATRPYRRAAPTEGREACIS